MPLPLREPFFLKGRTSVVQRAVIMSVVLGGLASVAGWLVTLVMLTTGRMDALWTYIKFGLAIGFLIYRPLNYWNCRSASWTLFSILAIVGLFLVVFGGFENGEFWPESSTAVRTSFGGFFTLSAAGFLQLRATRLHIVAYIACIAAATVPALLIYVSANPSNLSIPGLPPEVAEVIANAAVLCLLFGSLAIPWGIPFWWPPANNATAEAVVPAF